MRQEFEKIGAEEVKYFILSLSFEDSDTYYYFKEGFTRGRGHTSLLTESECSKIKAKLEEKMPECNIQCNHKANILKFPQSFWK